MSYYAPPPDPYPSPSYPPPSGPPPPAGAPLPAYTDGDAEALFGVPPPAPHGVRKLPLPFALPQTATSYDSPFARAYAPSLAASGIDQQDWLRFTDGLNIAMTASPPLRVIDLAGMIIGFVPYHWCIIAGAVMQTAAQTASHIISKTLTDRYLQRANKTYFEPRGLKVRLMKTPAMRKFIGLDAPGKEPGKAMVFAKTAGRTAENIALHLPIPFLGRAYDLFAHSPKVDPNNPNDMTGRRLETLQGWILPNITQNVPPPIPPSSMYDKASALGVKLSQWKSGRGETKAMRQRRLLAISQGRPVMAPIPSSSNSTSGVGRAFGTFMDARQERKDHRTLRMAGRRRGQRKLRGSVAKADRLEVNRTTGIVWVVLFNAEDDAVIEGRDLADDPRDEEIDDDEWQEEIDLEDEEEEEYEMRKRNNASGTNGDFDSEYPDDKKGGAYAPPGQDGGYHYKN